MRAGGASAAADVSPARCTVKTAGAPSTTVLLVSVSVTTVAGSVTVAQAESSEVLFACVAVAVTGAPSAASPAITWSNAAVPGEPADMTSVNPPSASAPSPLPLASQAALPKNASSYEAPEPSTAR